MGGDCLDEDIAMPYRLGAGIIATIRFKAGSEISTAVITHLTRRAARPPGPIRTRHEEAAPRERNACG